MRPSQIDGESQMKNGVAVEPDEKKTVMQAAVGSVTMLPIHETFLSMRSAEERGKGQAGVKHAKLKPAGGRLGSRDRRRAQQAAIRAGEAHAAIEPAMLECDIIPSSDGAP